MDWMVMVFVAVLIFVMFIVSRKGSINEASSSIKLPEDANGLPGLRILYSEKNKLGRFAAIGILICVVTLLAPAYQNYVAKSQSTSGAAGISSVLIKSIELSAVIEDEGVDVHLSSAVRSIKNAMMIRSSSDNFDNDINSRKNYVISLNEAIKNLDKARLATSSAENREAIIEILREINSFIDEVELGGGVVSISIAAERDSDQRIMYYFLAAILTLFLITTVTIYFRIHSRNHKSSPSVITKRIRASLAPIVAIFSIAGGAVIVLIPGVEASTAAWGAGIAGSGFGYWLGSTGT